ARSAIRQPRFSRRRRHFGGVGPEPLGYRPADSVQRAAVSGFGGSSLACRGYNLPSPSGRGQGEGLRIRIDFSLVFALWGSRVARPSPGASALRLSRRPSPREKTMKSVLVLVLM